MTLFEKIDPTIYSECDIQNDYYGFEPFTILEENNQPSDKKPGYYKTDLIKNFIDYQQKKSSHEESKNLKKTTKSADRYSKKPRRPQEPMKQIQAKKRLKDELPDPTLSHRAPINRNKAQTGLRLPRDLFEAVKELAKSQNKTHTDWMTEAIVEKMEREAHYILQNNVTPEHTP